MLAAATGCTSALNNSVPKPAGGADVSTTFTPQGGLTLAQAAQACGFVEFDWQQTITTLPAPSPFLSACSSTPLTAPPAFNDPPACGYAYQHPPNAVMLPVYYNLFTTGPLSLSGNSTTTQLSFYDAPADPCLPGTQSASTAAYADTICGGAGIRAPAGSKLSFTTHLVGIQGALPGASVVDTGIGFTWTSDFNGTSGGIAVLTNPGQAVDSGSGTGGYTITGYTPTTTYNGVAVTAINGSNNSFGTSPLVASVLPESRSAQPGGTVTAFATIINTSSTTVTGCSIAPAQGLQGTFLYQTTDPTTNALTGTANTPVDITGNNGSQSFVIAFTPSADIAPTDVGLNFSCTNLAPAPIASGLDTLLLSASTTTATPDVVALGATTTGDGILHIAGSSGSNSFAVATVNLGSTDTITAAASTGSSTLPVTLTICQTTPSTGQCMAPPAASVTTSISSHGTPTFGIFATATGAIPFDPSGSRIFVTFTDSGNAVRGETSVAVTTQ